MFCLTVQVLLLLYKKVIAALYTVWRCIYARVPLAWPGCEDLVDLWAVQAWK